MFPHLGPLPFPTSYGLLVALGLVVALLLIRRLAPRVGLPGQQAQDVVVWACLGGLLGAKLLLILLEPQAFFAKPWEIFFQGGVFYGGAIGGAVTLILVCLKRGIDPNALGDACAPAMPLGHALGRVGCFLAGCCWGSACELPWGVAYTHPEAAAAASIVPFGATVHPVQLYEAVGNVMLAGLIYLVFRRRRFAGQAWWSYVAAYAVLRFVLEGFRGDPRGAWFGGVLSTSQGVAVFAILASLTMLVIQSRRGRLESLEPCGEAE